jgi:hypothetical protein
MDAQETSGGDPVLLRLWDHLKLPLVADLISLPAVVLSIDGLASLESHFPKNRHHKRLDRFARKLQLRANKGGAWMRGFSLPNIEK